MKDIESFDNNIETTQNTAETAEELIASIEKRFGTEKETLMEDFRKALYSDSGIFRYDSDEMTQLVVAHIEEHHYFSPFKKEILVLSEKVTEGEVFNETVEKIEKVSRKYKNDSIKEVIILFNKMREDLAMAA